MHFVVCAIDFSAAQQSPNVLSWIKSWLGEDTMSLNPDKWLTQGQHLVSQESELKFPLHTQGKSICMPPSGDVDLSIECGRLAQLKEPFCAGCFCGS